MSKFKFLHKEWPAIYKEAEQLTLTSPKASVMIARSALEKTEYLFNSLLQKSFKGELV